MHHDLPTSNSNLKSYSTLRQVCWQVSYDKPKALLEPKANETHDMGGGVEGVRF